MKVTEDKFQSKGIKSVRSRVTNITGYLSENITVSEFKELLLKYMFDEDTELTEGHLEAADLSEINSLMKRAGIGISELRLSSTSNRQKGSRPARLKY